MPSGLAQSDAARRPPGLGKSLVDRISRIRNFVKVTVKRGGFKVFGRACSPFGFGLDIFPIFSPDTKLIRNFLNFDDTSNSTPEP
jgi:hypothetical protein